MIDETILDDILKNGKSKLINDFISKKGSKFPAYLVLDGNGVKFEYLPRKKKKKNKKNSKHCSFFFNDG